MNRRKFIINSLLQGTLVKSVLADQPSNRPSSKVILTPSYIKIDKVIQAMLAMQRYAWEQGVAAQALLEWGETEWVVLMAKDAVLRQLKDGRLAVVSSNYGVTDPAANGEAVLFAAQKTGDQSLKEGAEKMLSYLLTRAPRTSEGVLHHVDHKPQVWVDSLYMAPPFMAVAGASLEAINQIWGFKKLLWNNEKRLFSQIWDDGAKKFIRKDFWGVGNGWAATGILRVIKSLPQHMIKEKAALITFLKEIVDGCLSYQRHDHLFHDVIDKPTTFVETNLSQMLAYTIYRSVKADWLPTSYIAYAEKMRQACHAKVDKFGLVQGVCGAPNFSLAGTATEGQAFFILMEAAARDFNG